MLRRLHLKLNTFLRHNLLLRLQSLSPGNPYIPHNPFRQFYAVSARIQNQKSQ